MPKSENYSTTTVTDSRGKKSVKVYHTLSESSMKRSYHERYQMVDLLSLPTFIILFVLVVFASTILYFKNNINTYMPDGETYVQYTDQEIIDMQLETPITELNGNTLKQVFEESLIFNSLQLVTNGDFSNGTTGWTKASNWDTLVVESGRLKTIEIALTAGLSFAENTYQPTVGQKYYYSFNYQANRVGITIDMRFGRAPLYSYTVPNTSINFYSNIVTATDTNKVRITSNPTTGQISDTVYWDNVNGFNISTFISNKQYSPLFNTTFDLMTDSNIKTQMDYWVNFPYKMLDFNELGWFPTQAEQNYWEEVWYYIKTIGPQPETIFALGTIDPNTGRDFYHLDVSDYESLGNNIKSSFKGLATMIKGMTHTIESIGDFLAKVGGTIEDFYDQAYEFMSGETVDEVWMKAQNIWLWITGKGWAVKQP